MQKGMAFRKKIRKNAPHLRWNYEIMDSIEGNYKTGVFHFAVVGDRRTRKYALETLAMEITKSSSPIKEIYRYESGTVKNSKYNYDFVIWESNANPNMINWGKIKVPIVNDKNLYTRVMPRRDVAIYIQNFFEK